jgi:hypothetical protein
MKTLDQSQTSDVDNPIKLTAPIEQTSRAEVQAQAVIQRTRNVAATMRAQVKSARQRRRPDQRSK